MCKIRHFADIKILCLIYFSLFHSHLQYCIIDWGRAYKTVIRPVQVLQNRIVKYMTFSNRTSSASNIFKLLKILKFLICTNLVWKSSCISIMPISCPLLLITFFRNCTTYMIMARDKFQEIFIVNVSEMIIVKKCCNV